MRPHSSLTKSQQAARIHYFKRLRADNPNTPVESLWASAMREVFFRIELSERVKQDRKRSKAAKRGWATRKAA